MMSMAIATLVVMSASAIVFNHTRSGQVETVDNVQEKPTCSQIVNGKICGGTLELSFTAYKEKTDQNCPFCNGTGKNCKYDHCDKGKLWEWRSAYVCKSCGALYDVSVIQSQM